MNFVELTIFNPNGRDHSTRILVNLANVCYMSVKELDAEYKEQMKCNYITRIHFSHNYIEITDNIGNILTEINNKLRG